MKPRPPKPGRTPFVWLYSGDLDHITDSIEGADAAHAIAVYAGAAKLANREHDNTFTATISSIARASGLGHRKTFDMIGLLERIGLLRVKRQKLEGTKANAPSTYTLCTACTTSCTETAPTHAENKKEEERIVRIPAINAQKEKESLSLNKEKERGYRYEPNSITEDSSIPDLVAHLLQAHPRTQSSSWEQLLHEPSNSRLAAKIVRDWLIDVSNSSNTIDSPTAAFRSRMRAEISRDRNRPASECPDFDRTI